MQSFLTLYFQLPPFPDTIAFTKCKREGVVCHHTKILLLHHRDITRAIITSTNLGPVAHFGQTRVYYN